MHEQEAPYHTSKHDCAPGRRQPALSPDVSLVTSAHTHYLQSDHHDSQQTSLYSSQTVLETS